MEYEIIPLPKEEWKGTPILMRYTTEEYYDLETSAGADSFQVQMVKKKFEIPVTHTPEEWSNRLMITELWVADELQRQGIGTRLMNLAKEQAKLQGRRAIILETQSCNVRAIAFYRSQGFELIGYDSCCYTNRDVERHEIRFDFGYFMHKNGGRYETLTDSI